VTEMPDPGTSRDRLHRLLGGEQTAWLVRRVRDRIAAGRPLSGTVTLTGATADQRRAVERLTGRPARSGASLSVSLAEVDRILRSSGAASSGLEQAIVELTGPVRDRGREKAAVAAAWTDAFAPLDEVVSDRNALVSWRVWLDMTGVVRRLAPEPAAARELLGQVAAVLRQLPSPGVPIGRLAAECCGDAHALDDGHPAGTLALSAARALAGQPFTADGKADARRTAWAAVGVYLDDLSSLVLCLGLSGDTGTPLGQILGLHREAGQPAVVTLRQLHRHDGPMRAGTVWICENPVVVAAAADELGSDCPPMVCAGGRPSAAVWRLLDLLAAGGAEFRYHGDFDWGGIQIADAVRERAALVQARWMPWRYDRDAYEALAAAVSRTARPGTVPSGSRLAGEPAVASWDPGLAVAMTRRGLRFDEELTLDVLMADLADEC